MWSFVSSTPRTPKRPATSDDEDNVSGSWSVVSSETNVSSYSQKSTAEELAKKLRIDDENKETRSSSPTESVASSSWTAVSSLNLNFDIHLDGLNLDGVDVASRETTRPSSPVESIVAENSSWQSRYQQVFEYKFPLMHPEHGVFNFMTVSMLLRDDYYWRRSYNQLKRGVHVTKKTLPDPEIVCFESLELAVQFLSQDPEDFEKLIFVHKGEHSICGTLVIPPNFQIIGASNSLCVESSVVLTGRSNQTALEFCDLGVSFLGYVTVQFAPRTTSYFHEDDYDCHAVKITGENVKPVFERCHFKSKHRKSAVVWVTDSASPSMKSCTVTCSPTIAMLFSKGASGEYTNCRLSTCRVGASLEHYSNPTFKDCRIDENSESGVVITGANGRFENCKIHSNKQSGMEVMRWPRPNVQKCAIYSNKSYGIYLHDESDGVFFENTIFQNGKSGVRISERSKPTIRENTVEKNLECGLTFDASSGGVVEKNTVRLNRHPGIEITADSDPHITGNILFGGKAEAILVSRAKGTIEKNEIRGNSGAGVFVTEGATPKIDDNFIAEGKQAGVFYDSNGQGTLSKNRIHKNDGSGVCIRNGSSPIITNNEIKGNRKGLTILGGAGGQIMHNSILNSAICGVHFRDGKVENVCNETSEDVVAPKRELCHNRIFHNQLGIKFDRKHSDHVVHHNTIFHNVTRGVETPDKSHLSWIFSNNETCSPYKLQKAAAESSSQPN